MKHVAVVCNPTAEAASRARPMAETIASTLQQKGVMYTVFLSEWPSNWEGFTDVWLVGGDGTLHYFVNQYLQLDLPLALFPGGTGNDFHWALYGTTELESQIEGVLNGRLQEVDAGLCNGRLFLNGVGIGFDGAIVKDLIGKKKLAGKASYLLSILKNIARFSEKRCRLEWGNQVMEQDCFMIAVANGSRYGGGFHIAPAASVTDGWLDLVVVGRIAPLQRIRYLPVIEKGEHLRLPFIQTYLVKEIRISSTQPLPAHLDGEFLETNQFTIQLAAKKFTFVVPADAQKT